jgi:hypothetical protein
VTKSKDPRRARANGQKASATVRKSRLISAIPGKVEPVGCIGAVVKIGELLVYLGLLSEPDLNEASHVAADLGLPIGKALVMSGYVSEIQLRTALLAQSMLKDQLVDLATVSKAVKLMSREPIGFQEALFRSGWMQVEPVPTSKLGELMLESGIVPKDDLEIALRYANETGLPLGIVLVNTRKLSPRLLHSCLTAQVLLRDQRISRDQAINALKAAYSRQTTIERVLEETGHNAPAYSRVRIGELFVLSEVLSEEQIMEALEIALLKQQMIGEVLIDLGRISKGLLESAIEIQHLVQLAQLTPLTGAEALRRVYLRNIPVAKAVAELGLLRTPSQERVKLGELLKLAGMVTEDEIQEALKLSMLNNALLGKILLISGFIDELTLQATLRCQFLMREGILREDQAIMALHFSARMRCSMDDAVRDLGWMPEGVISAPREQRLEAI